MKPVMMFECTACGDLFDNEDEAVECRCHDVRVFYLCPVCDEDFRTEGECADHIDEDHAEESAPAALTSTELEAAGQQRLLP